MSEIADLLLQGANELGIHLGTEQISQFEAYCALLSTWNEKFNLTAIIDPQEITLKHFIDSLTVIKHFDIKPGAHVIDIGTGAGFPGIPLKIARPDISLVLLDSLQKRTHFLEAVVDELSLSSVTVIHGRAEEVGREAKYRELFDIAVSRAVAPLSILCEYCLPLVRVGGYFIPMKGPDIVTELADAQAAISLLGGKNHGARTFSLPVSGDARSLVFIEKQAHTPAKYPRKAGTPKKEPLRG